MNRQRLLLALATIGIALSLTATPAQAASSSYVALGDSYSSGVGARTYYNDGTDCYRSPKAYGALIAADYGLSLTLVACSGAATQDVLSSQVSSLSASTRYVSMTVGGNDVGFTSVLTECALPSWMSNCGWAIDRGVAILRTDLPSRMTAVLAAIKARSPGATVVVAGYPHIFNGQDCNAATFFSPSEESRLNSATDELNRLLQTKTVAAGMTFVNPVSSFSGHAVCDSSEWINGLSFPIVNSYHPNKSGYRAYASLVGPALVGTQPRSSTSVKARTRVLSEVRLPRGTTSAGSFEFTVPDLNSAKATRAAAQAGITPAELQKLRNAQQAGGSNATLERMNKQITAKAAKR